MTKSPVFPVVSDFPVTFSWNAEFSMKWLWLFVSLFWVRQIPCLAVRCWYFVSYDKMQILVAPERRHKKMPYPEKTSLNNALNQKAKPFCFLRLSIPQEFFRRFLPFTMDVCFRSQVNKTLPLNLCVRLPPVYCLLQLPFLSNES